MERTTLPAPVPKDYGALTVTASRTVDGGYAINTMTGPHREANLCFTTPDREAYRLAYRVIAEGGLNGVRPDGIHVALVDALRNELHAVQRRYDGPSQARVEHINNLLDLVDPVSDSDVARLVDAIGGVPERARSFADIARLHQAAVERDRAERRAA